MRARFSTFTSVLHVLAAVALVALALPAICLAAEPPAELKDKLTARLDTRGPYLILATDKAAKTYADAIGKAKSLHPNAAQATFSPDDLAAAAKLLRDHHARYVMLFILPDELDVNFAWSWLTLTTQVDDDPLVDVRTGFITGRTRADAAAFIDRIAAAASGKAALPAALVDNFGPNPQAPKADFVQQPGNFVLPALSRRLGVTSISHGTEAFTDARLESMAGAGLVHFGGHGHPDRIDDGLRADQAKRLRLSPCVAFNGACYTGVTGRWFDQFTRDGTVAEMVVDPADSFCLNFLTTDAIAYLAALHPDHGMPVYQEMEFLAYGGASLGDVIKHTHDGVILAAGGRLPPFKRLKGGMLAPKWTPTDIMLKGTASRVLFGDPSIVVADPFTDPPFKLSTADDGNASLRVTATLVNASLKSTFTDTYHADLSRNKDQFNDRAAFDVMLPQGWDAVKSVEVIGVTADGKPLKHRLVAYAIEHDDATARRLHVQVDVPAEGFMTSAFRVAGATVEVRVGRE